MSTETQDPKAPATPTPTAPAADEGAGYSEGVDPAASAPVAPTEPVKAKAEPAKKEKSGSIDPDKAPAKKNEKPAEKKPGEPVKAKQDPDGKSIMLTRVKHGGEYYEKGGSYTLDKNTEAHFRKEGFIE